MPSQWPRRAAKTKGSTRSRSKKIRSPKKDAALPSVLGAVPESVAVQQSIDEISRSLTRRLTALLKRHCLASEVPQYAEPLRNILIESMKELRGAKAINSIAKRSRKYLDECYMLDGTAGRRKVASGLVKLFEYYKSDPAFKRVEPPKTVRYQPAIVEREGQVFWHSWSSAQRQQRLQVHRGNQEHSEVMNSDARQAKPARRKFVRQVRNPSSSGMVTHAGSRIVSAHPFIQPLVTDVSAIEACRNTSSAHRRSRPSSGAEPSVQHALFLDLSNVSLGSKIDIVVDWLAKLPEDIALHLSLRNVQANAVHIGCILDECAGQLQTLNLSCIPVSRQTLENVQRLLMLENGALETLYLNECHLSDGAAAGLLRSANSSANPSLRSLHLSRNSCAAQTAEAVAVFLRNHNCKLTELNLSWNSISPNAVIPLFSMLMHDHQLQSLNLSWNRLGNEGRGAIVSSTRRTRGKRRQKGDAAPTPSPRKKSKGRKRDCARHATECVDTLCKLFHENTTLDHFDLSHCGFDKLDCEKLAVSLGSNRTLCGFHFDGNSFVVDTKGFLLPRESVSGLNSSSLRLSSTKGLAQSGHHEQSGQTRSKDFNGMSYTNLKLRLGENVKEKSVGKNKSRAPFAVVSAAPVRRTNPIQIEDAEGTGGMQYRNVAACPSRHQRKVSLFSQFMQRAGMVHEGSNFHSSGTDATGRSRTGSRSSSRPSTSCSIRGNDAVLVLPDSSSRPSTSGFSRPNTGSLSRPGTSGGRESFPASDSFSRPSTAGSIGDTSRIGEQSLGSVDTTQRNNASRSSSPTPMRRRSSSATVAVPPLTGSDRLKLFLQDHAPEYCSVPGISKAMQRELELKTRQLLNEKQNGGTSQAVVPGMGGGPRCWLCERWMVIDFCFTLGDSSVPDKFDAATSTIQLHTSLDADLKPDPMTRGEDGTFRTKRMVPWGHRVEYFFSIVHSHDLDHDRTDADHSVAPTPMADGVSLPAGRHMVRKGTNASIRRSSTQRSDASSSRRSFQGGTLLVEDVTILSAADQLQICCSQQLRAVAQSSNLRVPHLVNSLVALRGRKPTKKLRESMIRKPWGKPVKGKNSVLVFDQSVPWSVYNSLLFSQRRAGGETAPFALFNDREAWDEHFEHDWELIASCTAFKTYLEETNSQIQELMSGIAPELRTLSSSVNSDARTEASDLESMGEIASLISNDDLYDIASSPPQSAMSRRSRRRGFGSMVLEDDDTSCGENSVFSEGLSASVPTSTVHAKSGKHLLSSMAAAVRANYESLSRIYDFFAVLYGQAGPSYYLLTVPRTSWTAFCQESGLVDQPFLDLQTLEKVFLQSNADGHEVSISSLSMQKVNTRRELLRFEFVLALLRVAVVQCLRAASAAVEAVSTIEDPYRTFASAFKVLVAVITAPQCKFHAAALSYDGDAFRRQYLYTEATEEVVNMYFPEIIETFRHYCWRSITGERMYLDEWVKFCQDYGFCTHPSQIQEMRLTFLRAKLSVAEEAEPREDKLTMGFVDFVESLVIRSQLCLLPKTSDLIMQEVFDVDDVLEEPEDDALKEQHPQYGAPTRLVLGHELVGQNSADLALSRPTSAAQPVTRNYNDLPAGVNAEVRQSVDEAHNVVFNNLLKFMLFKKFHCKCESDPGGRPPLGRHSKK